MKTKLLMYLLFAALFVSFVSAIPCVQTIAKIGTISSVFENRDANYYTIELNNVYNFYEKFDKSRIDISIYDSMVDAYLSDKKKLNKAEIKNEFSKSVYVLKEQKNYFKVGDIVVEGPPAVECGFNFKAIYSPQGEAKYLFMRDLTPYNFHGTFIDTSVGKELDCQQRTCNVYINFKIGDEEFELYGGGAGQSLKNPAIKSVNLYKAKYLREGLDSSHFDWGTEEVADYVIEVGPEDEGDAFVPEEETVKEEPKTDAEIQKDEPVDAEPKQQNIFQRFFAWLLGLFS